MSLSDLRDSAIKLTLTYLIDAGLHKYGKGLSYNQKFSLAILGNEGVDWIVRNYGRTIGEFLGDTFELGLIIQKSKINMNEALEDYRRLKAKKARRLADKILADNRV